MRWGSLSGRYAVDITGGNIMIQCSLEKRFELRGVLQTDFILVVGASLLIEGLRQ